MIKGSIYGMIKKMEVGQKLSFPIARNAYVKRVCSDFGLEWKKKYRTNRNLEEQTVEVVRLE